MNPGVGRNLKYLQFTTAGDKFIFVKSVGYMATEWERCLT